MRRLVAATAALITFYALLPVQAAQAATPLTITFVDAGQGDAAIYRGPCGDIGIIDIPDGEAGTVADHLSPFPNASVRWVAASHYHADHIGGIDDFLAVQDVDAVYDRGGDRTAYDSETYRSYYDVVTSVPGVRQTVDIDATFTLCSGADLVTFSVVSSAPDGTAINGLPVPDENDRSLCLKVTHANFDLATCGDINGVDDGDRTNIETPASAAIGDVEVAKVNHHGSAYSSNQTWVNTLNAEAAIIPVGANSFGHPDPAVVQRWTASGATVSRTDAGDVTVTYDRDTSTFSVQQGSTGTQHAVDDTNQPPTTPPSARSIDSACTFNGGFEDGFADVPSTNPHERAIDCIVYWQVTTGVRVGVYDPSNTVTRAQMASFLARFIERSGGTLPSNAPNAFPDDNGDRHEPNINKLAAVGVVAGRADGTYAPDGPVYRNQMATFIIRALEYRLDGPVNNGQQPPDYFTDDNADNHQTSINKAAAIGITGGTSNTEYSPQLRVRRDQMGSFLARGLAEIVDETDATIPAPPPKCGYDASIERTDSRCRPCPYNSSIGVTNPNCKAPTPPPPPPPPSNNCDPSYPDVCIPPPPPDLDCGDISHRRFRVVGSDPHGFDGDSDGIGCEG